ncbi:MAG: type II secretion system protein [Gammaproteobacteria bacterium]|nr:type II secretion system protein [Gammaproteobacteria bacterium]
MYRQKGFTLIELIVVIVILGLLAATALPRFVDLTGDARLASLQGVAGGLRSAAALSKAQFLVNGSSAGSINMDGVMVLVNASGYPQNATTGIERALASPDGWSVAHAAPNTTYTAPNAPGVCTAVYSADTGSVTITSAGCGS